LADDLTIAALGISVLTLIAVVVVLITIKRKTPGVASTPEGLETTMGRVEGKVQDLHSAVSQLLPQVGEIKAATTQASNDLTDVKKVTDLLGGSSQKRGRAGELIIREYIQRLPREMWVEQYDIPGTDGRVDFGLWLPNEISRLLLPIDSKFSLPDDIEDYEGEANRLALQRAQELEKYVVHDLTTDFVVMVLPNRVFYALESETVSSLGSARVVACPPEGVIILCNFAMRAQQAVVLGKRAGDLRNKVVEINDKLGRIAEDITKLGKHLKGASNDVKQTLSDIDDTRSTLTTISTQLGDSSPLVSPASQPEALPQVPDEKERDVSQAT
jgi:DNA anti-recombination protein RmuC